MKTFGYSVKQSGKVVAYALAMVACVVSSIALAQMEAWVLTTRGFGPVKLGMMPADAKKATGGKFAMDGSDGGYDEYVVKGLGREVRMFSCALMSAKEAPLGEIRLYDTHGKPRYGTDKGIKVGDPAASLTQAYGAGLRKSKSYGGDQDVYTYVDSQDPNYVMAFDVGTSGATKGRVTEIRAQWKHPKRCPEF